MASHSREEAISEPENETDLDLVFNTVIDENFQKLLKYGSYNILFDLLENRVVNLSFVMNCDKYLTLA